MAVISGGEILPKTRLAYAVVVLMTVVYSEADFGAARSGPSPRSRVAPCPVRQSAFNDTGGGPEAEAAAVPRCVCAAGGDIRCHGGVSALPKLVVEHVRHAEESGTSFAGFYAARQDIGGVPAFAFAELPVDRIVLNFNPIGHRQARATTALSLKSHYLLRIYNVSTNYRL